MFQFHTRVFKYKCQTIWLCWPFLPLQNQIANCMYCHFCACKFQTSLEKNHTFDKLIFKVVKTMAHTQYVILHICGCNIFCHEPIFAVTFALWLIYMSCVVTLSTKKEKSQEIVRKEITLKFVGICPKCFNFKVPK